MVVMTLFVSPILFALVATYYGNAGLVGEPLPALYVTSPDGTIYSLPQTGQKPIIINFWATWCRPCQAEMQWLQQVHDRGEVALIAINQGESVERVEQFQRDYRLTLPIVIDSSGLVEDYFGVLGLPTTIFVDKSGIITEVHRGELHLSDLYPYLDS